MRRGEGGVPNPKPRCAAFALPPTPTRGLWRNRIPPALLSPHKQFSVLLVLWVSSWFQAGPERGGFLDAEVSGGAPYPVLGQPDRGRCLAASEPPQDLRRRSGYHRKQKDGGGTGRP